MRSSVMALLRAWTGGPVAACEALEPRLVLSAPTVSASAPTVTSSSMQFQVTYHSDTPMDQSTISEGDIAMTGPGGFAQTALFGWRSQQSNGDVVVLYYFDLPSGRWASGTYNVGIGADAVRNTAGEGNAATGLGSYWLWFMPQITMTGQRLVTGAGPQFIYPNGSEVGDDAWNFQFQQTTGYIESAPTLVVHVTGPNGYDQTTLAVEHLLYRQQPLAWYQTSVSGSVNAPGGTWDFTDSGLYTVQVGFRGADSTPEHPRIGELLMTRTFTQNIAAPRADVIASTVRTRDWLVTVRYTPSPGATISLASISNSDISAGQHSFGPLLGTLSQPPTLNADGSATAVYSIQAHPDGWTYYDSGPYQVRTRPGQVFDNAGRVVGTGPISANIDLSFDRPSVIGLRTLGAQVNAWDLELSFRNVGGVLNNLTLGGSNLSVYAEINGVFQLAPVDVRFVSSSNSSDNTLAIRYRVVPRQGFLWNGTYTVALNPQTMTDVAWGFSLTQAFVMRFAGPSVLGLQTLSRTSTAWDVQLSFNNPGGLINTATLSSQNLLVAAPGGRSLRISMISFTNGADHVLRVRYRIMPSTNTGRLGAGTYGFTLRAGSVFAAGVALPGQLITSVTI